MTHANSYSQSFFRKPWPMQPASIFHPRSKCIRLPCVFTNHLSERRILLLMLKEKWMPHNTTRCWVCLKYTRINKYKWKETSTVNLMGINRIRLEALMIKKVKKVRCHKDLLHRRRNLWCPGGASSQGTQGSGVVLACHPSSFITADRPRNLETKQNLCR